MTQYGDTRPHQQDWQRIKAEIEKEAGSCRYCKAATTRKGAPTMCQNHRNKMHLSYVTHPASETYWAS